MKNVIKPILIVLAGCVAAAIPFTGFYYLWSWCMEQVPLVSEWAGLIKIGITLAMVLVGEGATVMLAVLGGLGVISLLATILD